MIKFLSKYNLTLFQNLFEGLIWYILPIMMIVVNDIMAYMFGFFMGRTRLIQLSPKKTWEGFIGGGVSTVFISVALSYFLCQSDFMICPVGERLYLQPFFPDKQLSKGLGADAIHEPSLLTNVSVPLQSTMSGWAR